MPNYKKLAKSYEKNAILALQKFIRIPSVYDASSAKEGQPYGANVKKALDYFASLGESYGFQVDKCDGYATELSLGESGPLIGIYGHSDVVPATGSWTNPPFSATIKDGVIYGRGACDDKGPLLAAFFAVKLLKDNGLLNGFRVKIVSGGDEERGSSCLRYYFEKHHGEEPKFGFTPDANWPLIYAEKGITNGFLTKEITLGPIIAMDGGVVKNAVCDSLLVTLPPDDRFVAYLKEKKIDCDINVSPVLLTVRFKGKTAHGSTPELGINAAKIAFASLGEFYHLDFLTKLTRIFDPHGASFDGNIVSPELGEVTYNYGIVRYDGKTLRISLDMRYGEKAEPQKLLENLQKAADMTFEVSSVTPYLLYDRSSPLVATLMKAYKQETLQLFAKPLAIGGGTYAKEAKNTVAFGAEWPKHPGNMHSPDEYIYIDDFVKDIAIYARAIYLLGKAA